MEIENLLDPLKKIRSHHQSSNDAKIQDVDFYITKNTELEEPSKIRESRNFLVETGAIEVEGDSSKPESTINEVDIQKFKEETNTEQVQRPLMEKNFPIEAWDEASKTKIAQEYADWLIEDVNIRPIWINGATIFYRFNPENYTWTEIDFDLIKKKAHMDLGDRYTSHFSRQFKQSFQDHYKFIEFEEMGLGKDEILLRNGKILNLQNKDLRKVKKQDLALNCINVEFDEDAKSDGLKEFIDSTIDDEEMVKALQEYLGYTLTWPSDDFEKMLLILGNTDTGKSTLLKVIEKFFSGSNVTKISFPQIGMDRAFHIENLKDAVLNLDSDMDDQKIKRDSRIKKVISKEEIYVDPKGEKGFDMKPRANFIVTANNAPDDSGADDAYYNRFITLTATDRIPEEEKDREIIEKLTTEQNMSWLLNWAIQGLERLKEQNRFSLNRTEYETKKVWDKFGSSVQKFISSQITKDTKDGYNVKTTDLFEIYEMWCETELEDDVTQQKFIAQAASHPDLTKRKTFDKNGNQGKCFVDIKVKDYEL